MSVFARPYTLPRTCCRPLRVYASRPSAQDGDPFRGSSNRGVSVTRLIDDHRASLVSTANFFERASLLVDMGMFCSVTPLLLQCGTNIQSGPNQAKFFVPKRSLTGSRDVPSHV